ncbi:guanylate kinase [Eisenibacter elegans]|jgi:guanylate kinase|uniref:guanylate kinase n=1 Tax=Eisenibacter elegans TaxID=997 RepID=UPI000429E847|nr:guanylate kinase [Eisenibacter elegans]
MDAHKHQKIIIFSAPSGSGKTTIVRHLLTQYPDRLGFSISACTRSQRPNEIDGKDYYFLTPEAFRTKIQEEAFVEWEEVYENSFYGTLKAEVERIWAQGKAVLFDVDVKGGISLKNYFGAQALSIFVKVPSVEVLAARLQERNTDSAESLQKRIDKFTYELGFADNFDKVIINEHLDQMLEEVSQLVVDFLNQ